jgi:hypothetical protein
VTLGAGASISARINELDRLQRLPNGEDAEVTLVVGALHYWGTNKHMPSSFGILVTGGHRRHPASGPNWGHRLQKRMAPLFKALIAQSVET